MLDKTVNYKVLDNALREFSLRITKTSQSGGMKRWSAINSDTVSDLYGERMSLELYQKMIGYIKDSTPPPDAFKDMVCSDYWCGGMPYVSLAHYPDLNGKAVPGETLELFVDGIQLKAKGIFFDNKLGNAVWKSLQKDENKTEDRIRISIAFLDLAHKHGDTGNVWERKSKITDCPECLVGKGDKVYVDGYLVHLALTRVPVNPRTSMLAEKSEMAKKIQTRKEDAESIVEDKALVDEIANEALEAKSDVLVEMSDTEEVPVIVEEAKRSWKETTKEHSSETSEEDDPTPEDMKKGKMHKSLTAEDVVEIVKSLMPNFKAVDVVEPVSQVVEPVIQVKSALDISVDNLYNVINSALQTQSTVEDKLVAINPALQELGTAITQTVREASGEKPVAPVSNDQAVVLEAVTSLTNVVKDLATEVATLKAQTNVPSNVNRVPVPRSIQPQIQASLTGQPAPIVNPNSVANIVRRSVSNHLPLK